MPDADFLIEQELDTLAEKLHEGEEETVSEIESTASNDVDEEHLPFRMYETENEYLVPTVAGINVNNTVTTCSVDCELDLNYIATNCQSYGVHYSCKESFYATLRFTEPKVTAMIYKTGTIMTMRAVKHSHAKQAVAYILRMLSRIGEHQGYCPYKYIRLRKPVVTRHIVGKFKVPFDVSLTSFKQQHSDAFSVPSKNFRAIQIQMAKLVPDKLSHLTAKVFIFQDGSCMIMGSRSIADLRIAHDTLFPLLCRSLKIPDVSTRTKLRADTNRQELLSTLDTEYKAWVHVDVEQNEADMHAALQCSSVAIRQQGQRTLTKTHSRTLTNLLAVRSEHQLRQKRKADSAAIAQRKAHPPKRTRLVEGAEAIKMFSSARESW